MKKDVHVFFDLDDTMLKTQKEYAKVVLESANQIVEFMNKEVTIEEVMKEFNEIDVAASIELGLTKERFPLSWVKTYRFFAEKLGKEAMNSKEEKVHSCAHKIYENQFELYETVHETLKEIQKMGVVMHILTAGDTQIQNQRVDDAMLRDYFETVYVVPSKTPEVMKDLLEGRGESIMIGNSLRSDIFPALENGMNAIHLDTETWAYDHYDVDKTDEKYHLIQHFHELPGLLSRVLDESNKQAI